jgi:phospholipase/carboxylesterase
MAEAAGFYFEQVGAASSQSSPLVLLHGSGSCETFLLAFARSIAPDRVAFALRGPVPWEAGYAFFRRNPDRTLDQGDLAARCAAFCCFLSHLNAAGHQRPLLVGYSNGAIMAAAAAVRVAMLSNFGPGVLANFGPPPSLNVRSP